MATHISINDLLIRIQQLEIEVSMLRGRDEEMHVRVEALEREGDAPRVEGEMHVRVEGGGLEYVELPPTLWW